MRLMLNYIKRNTLISISFCLLIYIQKTNKEKIIIKKTTTATPSNRQQKKYWARRHIIIVIYFQKVFYSITNPVLLVNNFNNC